MDELPATVAPSRPSPRRKLWSGAAAVAGAAIGVLARDLPTRIAAALAPGTAPRCPTTGTLDCLFSNAGLAIADVVRIGLLALVISGCLVLAALACLAAGIAGAGRKRRSGDPSASERADWRTVSWAGFGSALLVCGGWLPAQLVVFLVR